MPDRRGPDPDRIAVFRLGHVGDTVVALPALWTVRRRFPSAHILWLSQKNQAGALAQGSEVLRPGDVYDEELAYSLGGGKVSFGEAVRTLRELKQKRIQLLVYLAPHRKWHQLLRDALFFRLAGVKKVVGMRARWQDDSFPHAVPVSNSDPSAGSQQQMRLPEVKQEADRLLDYVEADGISYPQPRRELMDLRLTAEEREKARELLTSRGWDPSQKLVSIGIGGKRVVNHWPLENYAKVIAELQSHGPVTFLFLGGKGELADCQTLAAGATSAVVAAGEFTVRESAAALENCALHIGNDTGPMHLAAAVKVPCVGIYTSRDWPGRWFPYGSEHKVLRVWVECEGCLLSKCPKEIPCIEQITPERVVEAALTYVAPANRPSRS